MNKSWFYGVLSAVIVLGSYLLLGRYSIEIGLIGVGLGILIGIFSFVMAIGEIKRRESMRKAIIGLVIGSVIGILLPLSWLAIMLMVMIGGPH